MRKWREISETNSCWNKAADDELVFVLLGRDVAAAATVRFWAQERIRLGENQPGDAKIAEALAWAEQVKKGNE